MDYQVLADEECPDLFQYEYVEEGVDHLLPFAAIGAGVSAAKQATGGAAGKRKILPHLFKKKVGVILSEDSPWKIYEKWVLRDAPAGPHPITGLKHRQSAQSARDQWGWTRTDKPAPGSRAETFINQIPELKARVFGGAQTTGTEQFIPERETLLGQARELGGKVETVKSTVGQVNTGQINPATGRPYTQDEVNEINKDEHGILGPNTHKIFLYGAIGLVVVLLLVSLLRR